MAFEDKDPTMIELIIAARDSQSDSARFDSIVEGYNDDRETILCSGLTFEEKVKAMGYLQLAFRYELMLMVALPEQF